MASDSYSFVRVDDFFVDVHAWTALGDVRSSSFTPETKTLTLSFDVDGRQAFLLLSLVQKDVFRLRFNPAKDSVNAYTGQNTRSVVMDKFDDLCRVLDATEPFTATLTQDGTDWLLITAQNGSLAMKLVVATTPFRLTAYRILSGVEVKLWESAQPAIRYQKWTTGDYAVIQMLARPLSAIYVGFGEQGGKSLVKNNEQLNFFSFDNYTYNQVYGFGPLENREPLYHVDPFFMELNGVAESSVGYGLFVDNPAQVLMDIGATDSKVVMIGTRFGDLDYYCYLGLDPADIIDGFTSLVGKARLKPRYALGYHQGCYGYEDRGTLEWVVAKYRQYQIPLDGLHIDVDIQDNYQTFTINQERFPNPKEMFASLRAQGVKCATNITPIISNTSPDKYAVLQDGLRQGFFVADNRASPANATTQCYQVYGSGNQYCTYEHNLSNSNYDSGKPYVGEVNYGGSLGTTGHYPDLARKDVRIWWGAQYKYLFDQGLEMIWQDMTTPAIRDTRGDMKGFPFQLIVTNDFLSDQSPGISPAVKVWNLFSYNLHKATYHGLNFLPVRNNLRNFIVGRGCFTGMHRFAALWTGDNASSWDFLRINVAQVLALGLCGQAIAGQDIGGFDRGESGQGWVGPELLMRWTMVGAFLPWFRNHYKRKGQKEFQEPFQYREWFQTYGRPVPDTDLYAMVVPVCRAYIQRRYKLLQLFYDLMFENTLTGLPICRPLFLTDPGDPALLTTKTEFLNDQFCVGNDLLIAPVLDPQTEKGGRRRVYLPAGSRWYCFMDDCLPLDRPVVGGATIEYDASLGIDGNHIAFLLPTYVREGAVIPTIEIENYVGERNAQGLPNPITFSIYPGQEGATTCYLDDGISRSSAPVKPKDQGGDELAAGKYRQVRVSHQMTGPDTRRIEIHRGHDDYTPKFEKHFYLSVLRAPDSQPLSKVTVNGAVIPAVSCGRKEDIPGDAGWFHADRANADVIKVSDTANIVIDLVSV